MKWHSLEESTPGTDFRSLHAIFAERKELIARYVPPETQAVHARVIAELKETISRQVPSPSAPKPRPSNSTSRMANRFHRPIC